MNQEQVFAWDHAYYMPVFARYPIVLSHGEGPYVYDTEGKKYLDFLAGIAVNILGHAHPALVRAVSEQAAKMIHCSNLYYTEAQATLARSLATLSGLGKVFIANSGAEANEGAIKLARKYAKAIHPDKVEIITAEHCFHGRTLATITATAQPKYQAGYEPLPGGFKYVAYNDIAALQAVMSAKTCAVMLEPIQGEGGIHVPDPGYLGQVRQLCDQYGALLIFDEIQSGMGRTGKMFAYEHENVVPDIATLAKGLGGGVPIGAFMAADKVAAAFKPGDHGTTFGGNPLASAAANAVLKTMQEEKILANVTAVGNYMVKQLNGLKDAYPALITKVRGKGLMLGMQLSRPGREIVQTCMERGLIINCTAGDVLRFVPPLIITREHVDEMVAVLDSVLAGAVKQ
ncbi:aminotransferase class-iii [Lucifera butyrica]|uniref:Acetylornithine aminotransferase n=1 Tax=Lucifera butyrica TaxID=1351585 RepID=A0A498R0P1_9FIRM|nr:acetylornithine transaminase [Lucifera butyrica]VBB04881.1 aminotransferase class-iii [Lucifera butyrica]